MTVEELIEDLQNVSDQQMEVVFKNGHFAINGNNVQCVIIKDGQAVLCD